jgi:FkbM family methyltransferase
MINSLKALVRRVRRPLLHKSEVNIAYDVLGTEYGGWPLVRSLTPQGALIYSFGVGEDISFDLAAIELYAAKVHAFDPTPRCLKWVAQQSPAPQFDFHAMGISDTDGDIEFFAPDVAEHVSFSATPSKKSDPSLAVKAPVRRLQTIIEELGTPVPDILKMDIEGFEYGVIADMLSGEIRPAQLLIEFHHYMYDIPTDRTKQAVVDLQAAGYAIFYVSDSGQEYGFVDRKRC